MPMQLENRSLDNFSGRKKPTKAKAPRANECGFDTNQLLIT